MNIGNLRNTSDDRRHVLEFLRTNFGHSEVFMNSLVHIMFKVIYVFIFKIYIYVYIFFYS